MDFKNILDSLSICSPDFWQYTQKPGVITRRPLKMLQLYLDDFGGCFEKVEDDIICDFRLLVPNIEDEQTLLINIHEFAHAYELYNKLGYHISCIDKTKSEEFARLKEEEYLNKKENFSI